MKTFSSQQEKKKNKAFCLFQQGAPLKEIHKEVGTSYPTVCRWAKEDKWREKDPIIMINYRFSHLLNKKKKTASDIKESQRLLELRHQLLQYESQQAFNTHSTFKK